MLAAAAPTVKLAPDTTPEQRSCAQDIDQALTIFWNLVERLQDAADAQQPIHQVEEIIFRDVLTMGLALLRSFLAASGDGDVGPTLTIPGERPEEPPHVLPRLDEPRSRPYLSIFGEVTIERVGYGEDRLDAAPLDARLHLPRRQYSHLLQRWLGAFVIDDAHAEAVRKLQMILGITIPVKASEDLNREQAGDVEPFQDHLPVPEPSQEGSLVVVTADCKGVPLIRSALAAAESEAEAQETPTSSEPHHRRGKGEKANKKRMAAVGAVYTIDRFVRTTDEVIDELQRKTAGKRRPRPRHKRVRADLLLGKVSLFLWLADELCRRNPEGTKPVVFLSDGERALHDRQREYLPEDVTCILDLLHVMERLWKVAWCLFEETTQKAEAERWVEIGGKISRPLHGPAAVAELPGGRPDDAWRQPPRDSCSASLAGSRSPSHGSPKSEPARQRVASPQAPPGRAASLSPGQILRSLPPQEAPGERPCHRRRRRWPARRAVSIRPTAPGPRWPPALRPRRPPAPKSKVTSNQISTRGLPCRVATVPRIAVQNRGPPWAARPSNPARSSPSRRSGSAAPRWS